MYNLQGTGDLMTALLLGWSNVRVLLTVSSLMAPYCDIYSYFRMKQSFTLHYAVQKFPDNLDKASELAVSSLQVINFFCRLAFFL